MVEQPFSAETLAELLQLSEGLRSTISIIQAIIATAPFIQDHTLQVYIVAITTQHIMVRLEADIRVVVCLVTPALRTRIVHMGCVYATQDIRKITRQDNAKNLYVQLTLENPMVAVYVMMDIQRITQLEIVNLAHPTREVHTEAVFVIPDIQRIIQLVSVMN